MITYVFRRPAFPIIVDIDGNVIAARTKQGLERKLSSLTLAQGRVYGGVDSRGEAWDLYAKGMMLSPLTLRKRATKLELIRLVNERTNKRPDEIPYSEKSLSAKTFETVFEDLVKIAASRPSTRSS
jgi:hypothetical protein